MSQKPPLLAIAKTAPTLPVLLRFGTLSTSRLAVAILFMLLFAMAARIPVDTDTWWHLRSGATIWQTHAVPFVDTFSLTKAGQLWIDQSWLAQIVLYGCYTLLGGSFGLALYTAVLATLGMLFVFATCRGSVYVRGFVAILSAATAAVFWSARPQMFSFALSAVTLYLIYRYKRASPHPPAPSPSGRGGEDRASSLTPRLPEGEGAGGVRAVRGWRVRAVWLLPPIMVLWVNLHSGFAIGFIFLGCALIGELLNSLANKTNGAAVGKLLVITLLSAAALLVNPYTVQMLVYPFQTAGIGTLQQSIQEWASPNFHARETWPFLILLFGTLAAVGFSKRGWDWTDLALVGVSAALALVWQRNFAVFAVAAAPTLCDHIATILHNAKIELRRESLRPSKTGAILNWAILVIMALVVLLKIGATVNPASIDQAQRHYLPVEAAAYLASAAPPGPLFNTYNWGGYLLFAAPNYPIFVDGRTDLYGSTFLDQWQNAIRGQGWQDLFSRWGIRLVVIEHDAPLADLLRHESNWQETYTDALASIFEKRG